MLRDSQGHSAKASDLLVNLTDGDHPPVRFVLFKDEKGVEVALPSEAIKRIDCDRRWFEVDDLTAATPVSSELLNEQARLRRDVLDSLVLDLKDRCAMRANDLWLEENDGELSLAAADGSGQAILRRLTRGWIDRRRSIRCADWKYVEFLSGDPKRVRDSSGEHMRIARLPAGEIAHLIEAMPYLHAAELLEDAAGPSRCGRAGDDDLRAGAPGFRRA